MEDEKELQQRVREFTRCVDLLSQDATPCQYQISASQAHALQVLGKAGKITQGMLAAKLHLDKSTISRLVTQLVEREWATRAENPMNRREVHLELTAKGYIVLDDVLAAGTLKYRRLWKRIPQDKRLQVLETLTLLSAALVGDEVD